MEGANTPSVVIQGYKTLFTVDSSETFICDTKAAWKFQELKTVESEAAMGRCASSCGKAWGRGLVVDPVEVYPTGYPRDDGVFLGCQASGSAQRESPLLSSLFNPGDPDLSFCDALAADAIKTESDLPPTTAHVEEFTDLMLFPDLAGLEPFEDLQDFLDGPMGGVDGPLKPRDHVISSVASAPPLVVSDVGEISPAESDISVDHFFNTFTDLTGFLVDLVEETGPSDLTDFAASVAESNETLTTDAELSAIATTNPPTTKVGSETACAEKKRAPRRPDTPSNSDDEAPPTKKARTTHRKCSKKVPAEVKYRQRRDKNNVASQRSRATRKQHEAEMAEQAVELESKNAWLRVRIDELTVIAEEARKCLVDALSQK